MTQNFSETELNDIPFHKFGGHGSTINFAHGNGYPPEAYEKFCSYFTPNYKVLGGKMRPLWETQKNPNELKSWDLLVDDMIHFMKTNKMKNVVGLAHSLGGTISILAAHRSPDLFSQLILLDPVVLSKESFLTSESLTIAERKLYNPFANASANRRDHWADKGEVFKMWRTKKVFKRFSHESLWHLVESSIVPDGERVTLAYSKEWETQIYVSEIYALDKAIELNIPVVVIRAGKGSVISEEVWEQWNREAPETTFLEFKEGGHLFPMEYPEKAAAVVNDFLT